MKQRYTKRIVAFALALAMVLTGGAFSTVFNTASASAASKKATLKLKKKVSITAGKKVTLKIKKKNVKKIKSQKWTTSKKSVATVSKKGKVTAKKAGKATIKVKVKYIAKGSKKVKKKTLKCTVTVKKKATPAPANVATKKPATTTPAPTTPATTPAPTSKVTPTPNPEAVIYGKPSGNDVIKYTIDDKSNIGEEKTVTFTDGSTVKSKDNGTVRKELSSQDLADSKMGMGVNIGNTLEAVQGISAKKSMAATDYATADPSWFVSAWGNVEITQKYLDTLHSYGINTVRIPVAWTNGDKDDGSYTINAKLLDAVEKAVIYALNNGMYVVINDHWDNGWWGQFGACKRDENNKKVANEEVRAKAWARYEKYWTQIAERFNKYSDHLIFEGANEEIGDRLNDSIYSNGYTVTDDQKDVSIGGNLKTPDRYKMAHEINQKFVDIIRATGGNNANRHLLIPGYNTDFEKTADEKYIMPTDIAENGKTKLFVSVHYYTPWDFCGDGGAGSYTYEDRQKTVELFKNLKRFSDEGYAFIIGECGVCSPQTVTGSVTAWFNDTFKEAAKYHAVPVLWETGQYFDRAAATLKFKDVAVYFNEINGANGDTSMTKTTGKSTDLSFIKEVGDKKSVWNWTGVWYKNGGDYAYGENRYNDKADKTNGEDPDVAKKMIPSSTVSPTIAGDTTTITFDGAGFQSFLNIDVSKYKKPAIAVQFAPETLDKANWKADDEDNVGHIQLGVSDTATFKDDVDIDYAAFADKLIVLDEAGLNLTKDRHYLSLTFSGRPTITGIQIYELGE